MHGNFVSQEAFPYFENIPKIPRGANAARIFTVGTLGTPGQRLICFVDLNRPTESYLNHQTNLPPMDFGV